MLNLSEKTKQHMDEFMKMAHKHFGEESLHLLGKVSDYRIETIPTGSIALDIALGVGGIPRGRIVELYGDFSSGKTTLCQHIIANTQKLGGYCVFIDTEHALDPTYAKACGVSIDDLFISQPDSGEQALELADKALDFNPAIIVIDSVAGLVSRAEIEGQMGDSHMALTARLMSQALRKLTGKAKKSNTTIIFTNQLRDTIGVMFGPKQDTTGGKALRFWASVRLECKARTVEKERDEDVGRLHEVIVKKNKVAPPLKKANFIIRFGEGISQIDEIIDYIENTTLLEDFAQKAGAWYTIKLEPPIKVQSKINFRQYLIENPAMLIACENALRTKLRLPIRLED